MKTVFSSTADVCAVWAAQEQGEARTSSNTRFRDSMLFSYSTKIGQIVESKFGRIALVGSTQYSTGTSKVQNEAKAAAKKLGMAVYVVPALDCAPGSINQNLAYYRDQIGELCRKIERAKDFSNAWSYRAQALQMIGTATLYAQAMLTTFEPSANPLTFINAKEPF